jgi:hypothetical protein
MDMHGYARLLDETIERMRNKPLAETSGQSANEQSE